MLSRGMSLDIVKYFKEKENLSCNDISQLFNTTQNHIEKILQNKDSFDKSNIDFYIESHNLQIWEFILEVIPLNHLPPKIKSKMLFCKKLQNRINRKKR
jgi:phospholipid N-methyltransferase